jgi:hypothetical protein
VEYTVEAVFAMELEDLAVAVADPDAEDEEPVPLPPSVGPWSLSNWAIAAQKVFRLSLSRAIDSPSNVIMLTDALVLMPKRWTLELSMLIMLSWQLSVSRQS